MLLSLQNFLFLKLTRKNHKNVKDKGIVKAKKKNNNFSYQNNHERFFNIQEIKKNYYLVHYNYSSDLFFFGKTHKTKK